MPQQQPYFLIGQETAEFLKVEVLNYERPENIDYCDANRVIARIQIQSSPPGTSCWFDLFRFLLFLLYAALFNHQFVLSLFFLSLAVPKFNLFLIFFFFITFFVSLLLSNSLCPPRFYSIDYLYLFLFTFHLQQSLSPFSFVYFLLTSYFTVSNII